MSAVGYPMYHTRMPDERTAYDELSGYTLTHERVHMTLANKSRT